MLAELSSALRPQPRYQQWLTVGHREDILLVSVDEVDYFQSLDKYTAVMTRNKEWTIRTPLKDLEATLNPDRFWRIHRSAIVRVNAIARVTRDLRGRHLLHLHGHAQPLIVSRLYTHRFQQM